MQDKDPVFVTVEGKDVDQAARLAVLIRSFLSSHGYRVAKLAKAAQGRVIKVYYQ